MNVLGLRDAAWDGELIDGNVVRHRTSCYLDFDIDERPLRAWFDDTTHVITALNRPWLGTLDESIAELTGRRPDPSLPAGRIAILRCAHCGDIGCGALTCQLDVTEDTVAWSRFAWENGYDNTPLPQRSGPTFMFDRQAYMSTLDAARTHVAAFPYDSLAHRGRNFLWPWQWGWRLPKP